MKFANILVPFDNSEHAQSALRIALDLVGDEASAELHVITVLPTATLAATYDASVSYTHLPERCRLRFRERIGRRP